jgi:hypothetical protein
MHDYPSLGRAITPQFLQFSLRVVYELITQLADSRGGR